MCVPSFVSTGLTGLWLSTSKRLKLLTNNIVVHGTAYNTRGSLTTHASQAESVGSGVNDTAADGIKVVIQCMSVLHAL